MSWIPDFVESFEPKLHTAILKSFLGMALAPVPCKYEGHRAMLLYMSVLGLSVLDQEEVLDQFRPEIIAYITSSELKSDVECSIGESPFLKTRLADAGSHGLVTTYLQLATLSHLKIEPLPSTVLLERTLGQIELDCLDLRSLYCYCALKTHFVIEFKSQEIAKIDQIVDNLRNYEGAFGLAPAGEAHAAATFLSVACLKMIGVSIQPLEVMRLVSWVDSRQEDMGFSVD